MAKYHDPLLETIEAYIAVKRMSATVFGIRALRDPMFVFRLRRGRELKHGTRQRVIDYITNNPIEDEKCKSE